MHQNIPEANCCSQSRCTSWERNHYVTRDDCVTLVRLVLGVHFSKYTWFCWHRLRLICPRMSQVGYKPKIFCSLRSQCYVLYPTLKTVAPPVTATVSCKSMFTSKWTPKSLAAPISVVWLHAWLGPHILIFQFRDGISLSPYSSAKVYYATAVKLEAKHETDGRTDGQTKCNA